MSNSEYTYLSHYRYERKFLTFAYSPMQVEQIIKLHRAVFYEIYRGRYVNNIYFDTSRLDFYYDNVEGRPDRVKIRIRWYGDFLGQINNPILEIKKKQGLVGTKYSFELPSFKLVDYKDVARLTNILKQANVPENIALLLTHVEPVLANRYYRKYFLDLTKKVRLTIDSDLWYYKIKNTFAWSNGVTEPHKIVIEAKYQSEDELKAKSILQGFPFRITKNSKYVTGIEAFYEVVD